ncbi:hypothetical protein GCM10009741_76130 [Kribbella lupini]|uniref:Uncharacterized protein n=1 Tax=Kribbella lupini TaxID=291602 RepID=A0ABN2CN62_9ACTN
MVSEQPGRSGAEFGDVLAVHLRDKRAARFEVAVQRADCHTGPTRDHFDVGIVGGEECFPCRAQQGFAVTAGIGAQWA